jgi:hypothetical protein
MRFEVFVVAAMKITVLWVETLCTLVQLPEQRSIRIQKTVIFMHQTLANLVTVNPYVRYSGSTNMKNSYSQLSVYFKGHTGFRRQMTHSVQMTAQREMVHTSHCRQVLLLFSITDFELDGH